MTNVKLKLMFYLLNALLTADIVHARPYSEEDTNSTNIVIKFTSGNNTFSLPVDPNSDTLEVANDDDVQETAEETKKNSETDMEAIVNGEQDRDEAFSKKTIKEQKNLEIPKNEEGAIEKQINISSSLLDKIIDSETDRDETLTDILFRPDAELVEDVPRFEFLIAAKINETENTKNVNGSDVSVNKIDKLNTNNSDVLKKIDYVELVEVLKPMKGDNKSAYNLANITVHEVDNDIAPDTRFTDTQTLFLACFATLVPLLGVLFATLLIRCIIRRWCPSLCIKSSASSESSSSEKPEESRTQLKSPTHVVGDAESNGGGPAANGSIITMTLKNNHLIVETEERHDMKNGRETKMKYSPDNDGIFVVEVQQSTAYRPNNTKSTSHQPSTPHDPQISTNQALIHRVPEDLKILEKESEQSDKYDNAKALALSSTGLSISDLSMSSLGSHNVSYAYGSQTGYEQGPFGYPIYAGYEVPKEYVAEGIIHESSCEPLITKTPTDPDKPVVTAAIFKQDSIIGSDALQGPGYCIEGSSDGPLLSDVQAREKSLKHLHDQMEKKVENGIAVPMAEKIESPKKTLNRADSLPVRLEEETVIDKFVEVKAMETITEDEMPLKEVLKSKRASLPSIRTDLSEIKDTILSSGSPKFEKLNNDVSPNDSEHIAPLITITEEIEAKPESSS